MAKHTLTLSTLLAIVLLAIVIIGCTVLHGTGILPISDIAVMGCDCDITQ